MILHCQVELAAGALFNAALNVSSLPFSQESSVNNTSMGTYFMASSNSPQSGTTSGVMAREGVAIYFIDTTTGSAVPASGLPGYIGFTLTYQTDD